MEKTGTALRLPTLAKSLQRLVRRCPLDFVCRPIQLGEVGRTRYGGLALLDQSGDVEPAWSIAHARHPHFEPLFYRIEEELDRSRFPRAVLEDCPVLDQIERGQALLAVDDQVRVLRGLFGHIVDARHGNVVLGIGLPEQQHTDGVVPVEGAYEVAYLRVLPDEVSLHVRKSSLPALDVGQQLIHCACRKSHCDPPIGQVSTTRLICTIVVASVPKAIDVADCRRKVQR
jgi:hypothetical protein